MSTARFKLDMFEGPLDLLLHLINKHKLNIYDIEIAVLLEQYLERKISLTILQYMCADCNCDGIVDEEDLSFLQDMSYK